ncbi:MAG: class I SAM-dependent methyltransferase [Acidisphaera sp.]|nr:class I SAM-dependent methyltransferase [Acidisphaera sp.]
MRRDTDRDWRTIAAEQPYWAVLSAEEFRGRDLDAQAKARFFESGRRLVAEIIDRIHRHCRPGFTLDRALDFGCGVGRLLLPIAERAREAVGVDVAPHMIELARQSLKLTNTTNATVVQGDDTLSQVSGRFNFVNSVIVLQHIPPERGYRIIGRLLALLEVGGVASLQLTYAKERRFFGHEAGLARYYRRDGDTLHDLLPLDTAPPEGTITMFDYDLNEIMLMVGDVAEPPVLVIPENAGHASVHLIFRKARD